MDQEALKDLKNRQRIGFIIFFLLLIGIFFSYKIYEADQNPQEMEKAGEQTVGE